MTQGRPVSNADAVVPFVNGRCHFYNTWIIFDLVLRLFLLKRKSVASQGRSRTFRILISLPYHFTTSPIRQNYEKFKSTWSYENRVSKHFVIFLNFRCLIACLLCCLLMSFVFLACLVVRDLCRSGCRQNYYLAPPLPPLYFFPYPQFFL